MRVQRRQMRSSPQTLARRVFATVVLMASMAFAVPAFADFSQANELLSGWQMNEADAVIASMESSRPGAAEVLYLRARHDFFAGRYSEAVEKLDQLLTQRSREDWEQLRELVVTTQDVIKDYTSHRSPSGYFEIWVEPGRDEVLLPFAFEALDAAYEAFAEEVGYRPETPIRVEIYPTASTLAAVSSLTEEEIRTSGTIALCKYNRLMITSPRALLRGYGWVDTLIHEYVHLVVNRRTANRVPIWMHEGIAKYLERRWRGHGHERLAASSERLLQKRVASNDLITFDQMHPSMAKLPSQEDASLAFAQVFTAMEYLRERAGPGAFKTLLDKIAEGSSARAAFASTLGVTFREFERDWKKSLKNRTPVELPEDDEFEDRLVFRDDEDRPTELSQVGQPKARDHMHIGSMLQARGSFAAAVVQYRKAERILGPHNPILQTRLARSLNETRDFQAAVEALNLILEAYPGYVVSWIELGRARLGLNDHEAAIEALHEAARINPFDPSVHTELAKAYEASGKPDRAEKARKDASLVR